jgi:hypothetical protein
LLSQPVALLHLHHRQFVFTLPELLRVYFKYDRNLFQDVSRIIFSITQDFYNESAPAALKTASVVSYRSFGDLVRWKLRQHSNKLLSFLRHGAGNINIGRLYRLDM